MSSTLNVGGGVGRDHVEAAQDRSGLLLKDRPVLAALRVIVGDAVPGLGHRAAAAKVEAIGILGPVRLGLDQRPRSGRHHFGFANDVPFWPPIEFPF